MHAHRILARACLSAILLTTTAAADSDYAFEHGQKVHRCAGRHGEIVFSGLTCTATESASSGHSAAGVSAPLPAADSCPASRMELRDRMVGAIARHDPNALAGMLRWRGIGGEAASSRLRSLRELTRRPLLALDGAIGAQTGDDTIFSAHDGLHVRTGGADSGGVHEHAFGVSLESGCYWLVW